jgi:hypothetical protein
LFELSNGVSLCSGEQSEAVLPETLSIQGTLSVKPECFCKEAMNLLCKMDHTTDFGV